MVHDSGCFRRAAEARAAAFAKDEGEGVEVAGQLAVACGALARRCADASPAEDGGDDGDNAALMLRG